MTRSSRKVAVFCLLMSWLPAYADSPFETARNAYRAEHWSEAAGALDELEREYTSPELALRTQFLRAVAQLRAGQAHEARIGFASLDGSALAAPALFNAAVAAIYEGKPEDSYAYLSKVPDSPSQRKALLSLSALTAMQLKREALAVTLQAHAMNVISDAEYAKLATPAAGQRDFQAWTRTLISTLGDRRGRQVAGLLASVRTNPVTLWKTDFDLPPPAESHHEESGWFGGLTVGGGSETYEQPRLEPDTGPSIGLALEGGRSLSSHWALRAGGILDIPLSAELKIKFFKGEFGPTWHFYESKGTHLSLFFGYSFLTTFGITGAGYGYENSSGIQARLFSEFAYGRDFIDVSAGYSVHATDESLSASNGEYSLSAAYRWHEAWHKWDFALGVEFRHMTLAFSQGEVKHQTLSVLASILLPE